MQTKKPKTASVYSGFTSLYHEIKAKILNKHNNKLFNAIIIICFVLVYLFAYLFLIFSLPQLTLQNPIKDIAFGICLLALVISAIFMVATFIILVIVGSRDSKQYVKEIVSWLLFSLRTPYTNRFGLNFQEITALKNIAQSEQSAADWRSTYINIVIIGAIGFLWGLGPNLATWFSENLSAGFQVKSLSVLEQSLSAFLGWGVVYAIVAIFEAKLTHYLYDFLISEFLNRAIIYACLESEALLLSQKFDENEILSIVQKKSIAKTLGYKLIKSEGQEKSLLPVEIFSQDGLKWVVIDNNNLTPSHFTTKNASR